MVIASIENIILIRFNIIDAFGPNRFITPHPFVLFLEYRRNIGKNSALVAAKEQHRNTSLVFTLVIFVNTFLEDTLKAQYRSTHKYKR